MQGGRLAVAVLALLVAGHAWSKAASFGATDPKAVEAYSRVPMPPGFKVVNTPLDGPVFADQRGRTLYKWPIMAMRQGYTGDPKDKSVCDDKVTTKTGGYSSPYPEGLTLPDLQTRKSCAALWTPVPADNRAKAVGEWSVVTRSDGSRQWAYDHHALYTSYLDRKPGDTLGGTASEHEEGGDVPAARLPVGPPPDVPPGFEVESSVLGRQLLTDKKMSVYASDHDGPGKSDCNAACERLWRPLVAPIAAQPHGDWSVVERSPGSRQWAFRKRPLYTYVRDVVEASLEGSDEPGWHNVYTQLAPLPPPVFSKQETIMGDVLADSRGMTLYVYNCGDDSADQLACDTPDSPQVYRLAICGDGDAERCSREWQYVPAAEGGRGADRLWSVIFIVPGTGREAKRGDAAARPVWAYRGRPVYTYAGDTAPGDYNGHQLGEWHGRRNGFTAFFIRSELFGRS